MKHLKAMGLLLMVVFISCEKKNNSTTQLEINKRTTGTDENRYYDSLFSWYKKKDYARLGKEIKEPAEESKEKTAVLNLYKGYVYLHQSRFDSAQVFFNKALQGLNTKLLQREMYYGLKGAAESFSKMGKFDAAINLQYKALDFLEKSALTDKNRLYYSTIGNLGINFFLNQDYNKSELYGDKALAYFAKVKDSLNLAYFESAKAVMLFQDDKFEASVELAKHSLELRKKLKDISGQAESNNNIAIAYMGLKNWDLALEYLYTSEKLFLSGGNNKEVPITIMHNIAHCLKEKNNIDGAIAKYELAYKIAQSKKMQNESRISLQQLSKLERIKGNYKEALVYYMKYSKTKDTLFNIQKEKAIQDVSTKYETKQKEEKIKLLQKDKQLAQNQRWMYVVTILFLIITGSIAVAYFVFRSRKNQELFLVDKKLHESEIERLKIEMELKRKALDNFTDKLLTKSGIINELEQKLNSFNVDHDDAIHSRNIGELSKMKILTEEDWFLFKEYFDKVYPGFIPHIRKKYNNLTPGELRMLLLIKLNLDSFEVASILGISAESVKKGRYRLKKKLELIDEDLNAHIQSLSF